MKKDFYVYYPDHKKPEKKYYFNGFLDMPFFGRTPTFTDDKSDATLMTKGEARKMASALGKNKLVGQI
jgi:hypothetical protein